MKKAGYDILFYLIAPLLIWNLLRKGTGDYAAMLLTTVPGFIYTVYFFVKDKTFHVTGIFILTSLICGRSLDLLAGSAEQMLWNDVFLSGAYIVFWTATIVLGKPMGMYFFIDYAYLQGYPRKESERFFRSRELFPHFQFYTALLALKSMASLILRTWCIRTYGVDGFSRITVIMTVNDWMFSGLTILYVLFIVRKIQRLNNGGSLQA